VLFAYALFGGSLIDEHGVFGGLKDVTRVMMYELNDGGQRDLFFAIGCYFVDCFGTGKGVGHASFQGLVVLFHLGAYIGQQSEGINCFVCSDIRGGRNDFCYPTLVGLMFDFFNFAFLCRVSFPHPRLHGAFGSFLRYKVVGYEGQRHGSILGQTD